MAVGHKSNDKIRVLVCDDNKPLRQLLTRMIAKHGYDVQEAESGKALLSLINAGNTYDLILLDVIMDDISGLEVLKELRTVRKITDTKICMATGKSDPLDVARAIKIGANDYIVKPIYEEILIPKIEKLTGAAPTSSFARLKVNLKTLPPNGSVVPDMITIEIGEEGFQIVSTAKYSADMIIPIKIPALENMVDFGGPIHCKVTSCSHEGFGCFLLRCDFVGLAESARTQLRAIAMRGVLLSDVATDTGVKPLNPAKKASA